MVLTETWLREQKTAELQVNGYTLFRQDRLRPRRRTGRDSGGVAIYLREDIAVDTEPILGYSNGVVEVVGLYNKSRNLLIFAVYRQPDDRVGGNRSTAAEFKQSLEEIKQVISIYADPMPDILLCGDFNLPHATWPDGLAGPGSSADERIMLRALMDIAGEFFLQQVIEKPTHKHGNVLDLLFTNNLHFLHSHDTVESIFSDHRIVECATTYQVDNTLGNTEEGSCSSEPGPSFHTLNFFSDDVDWEGLEDELSSHDWDLEFQQLGLEDMLRHFFSTSLDISLSHVPAKKMGDNRKCSSKIPRERKNLMRRRRRINMQLRKTTTESRRLKLKTEAREVEKKLQNSYRCSRAAQEHKAVGAIKKNSKYFFTYARKFSAVKSVIGPLIDKANNIITSPMKMAEILSAQYSSVYSKPKEPMQDADTIFPDYMDETKLHDITFTVVDVIKAIDEISPTAAAGPDRYPALLLKNCKHALAKPLYLIWRESLDSGHIPQLLKMGNIIPIHKGKSKGVPANYRPVALTSHLVKLFEKVLRNSIIKYMEEKNLFNPGQHGFRLGRSCLSQLVAHYDNIIRLLQTGQNVDVVYLDFAKAFDKVDFMVTMRKLQEMGITGKLGRWIHAFLTHRKQAILVNGARSEPTEVKSGVPQGSVLGPLLFLVLIGDIDRKVAQAYVSSFADDTRVSLGVTSVEDTKCLQNDLEAIYSWADDNNMEFNSTKFECMRYGRLTELRESTHYTSKDGSPIIEVDHIKDLGVTMSRDGTFSRHIIMTTETAKQMCGWILRTFLTRETVPMLTLWKSLIRSKLEYCCQLWNPSRKCDIQMLEQVQRNFIRKITGMEQLSYWEQLHALSMYSLERRRERYLIVAYYGRSSSEHQ